MAFRGDVSIMKASKIIRNGFGLGVILFLFHLLINYGHSLYLGKGFPTDIDYLYQGVRALIMGVVYTFLRTLIGENKKVESVY